MSASTTKFVLAVAVAWGLLLDGAPVAAQGKSRYQKVKTYDFTGDTVEGEGTAYVGDIVLPAPARLRGVGKRGLAAKIAAVKKRIASMSPGRARTEARLELAVLYGLHANTLRARAFELDRGSTPGNSKQAARRRSRLMRVAANCTARALELYAVVLRSRTQFARRDEALYYQAYTLAQVGRDAAAIAAYQRLVSDHPHSAYVPQAYLRLGYIHLDSAAYGYALRYFDKVVGSANGHLRLLARYGKGSAQLQLGRAALALEEFFVVADASRGSALKGLRRSALNNVVAAFSENGTPLLAHQVFSHVNAGAVIPAMVSLAGLYVERGQSQSAITVARDLLRRYPTHRDRCLWQHTLVRAALQTSNKKLQLREVRRLTKLAASAKRKPCVDAAAPITKNLAKRWHKEATKTLQHGSMAYAEALYRDFVQHYRSDKDIADIEYYLAEALWSRAVNEKNQRVAVERFERAAIAFTDVLKHARVSKKLQKEAAYAAVLAWKNALAIDPRTRVPNPKANSARPVSPRELPVRQRKMVAAFREYARLIKDVNDSELVMMKFLEARLYWRHDQLDKAIPRFEKIVKDHRSHEAAGFSAGLLLDALERLKRTKELKKWATYVLQQREFDDEEELLDRAKKIRRETVKRTSPNRGGRR